MHRTAAPAPRYPFAWIGAPASTPDVGAWTAYLKGLRDNLAATWSDAKTSYSTLKKVREGLGLQFIDDSTSTGEGGSAASHGAWTTDLDVQAQDIHAMVTFTLQVLDDVLAGKRRLQWNQDKGQFELEGLKADLIRLEQQAPSGTPVLIDVSTGQPTHVAGQVGAPAFVWVATFVGSALALPAYWAVDLASKSLTDVAEQKTMQTIAERQFACVQSGKCTPEQAAALGRAVYDGAKGLREEKAKQAAAEGKPTSDIADAVKTLGWIALGVAGIYLVARVVPMLGSGRGGAGPRLLPAHVQENPRRTMADIKEGNRAAGGTWFGRGEMKFFRTRIESALIGDRYFLTSEQFDDKSPRRFSIREVGPDYSIKTVGEFSGYSSKAAARDKVDELLGRA